MQYYPAYLELRGHPCIVIGGGAIAERKVTTLLDAGARVTVVSPTLTPSLAALAETHEIVHHARPYHRATWRGRGSRMPRPATLPTWQEVRS